MQQNISLNEIGHSKKSPQKNAFFNLAFRPFFLGASIFSIVSLTLWMAVYGRHVQLSLTTVTPAQWHAHEMLFGYAFAVIAGFLLTAVKNWTGIQTLHGKPLFALFTLWCFARLTMLIAPNLIAVAAALDIAFSLALAYAVAAPIIKVKQWRQLGILAKIAILTLANAAFYAQALGLLANGAHIGIIIGLYLTISLILVISRRVAPMFIERGVKEKVVLKQFKWLDISIMLFLVTLLFNELVTQNTTVSILMGILLFLANGVRLFNWHTKGIWKVPLLWSLYCGLWLINLGFLLLALSYITSAVGIIFAMHLWAIGGIGLMTLAMMTRVSLGHTGRSIHEPPKLMPYAFGIIIAGALIRAVLPIFVSQYYLAWVIGAYFCWVIGFALFFIQYYRILTKPRIDGAFG
jgi:uncharacterized protein involved in response to NO